MNNSTKTEFEDLKVKVMELKHKYVEISGYISNPLIAIDEKIRNICVEEENIKRTYKL